jgi:hypothetical protein
VDGVAQCGGCNPAAALKDFIPLTPSPLGRPAGPRRAQGPQRVPLRAGAAGARARRRACRGGRRQGDVIGEGQLPCQPDPVPRLARPLRGGEGVGMVTPHSTPLRGGPAGLPLAWARQAPAHAGRRHAVAPDPPARPAMAAAAAARAAPACRLSPGEASAAAAPRPQAGWSSSSTSLRPLRAWSCSPLAARACWWSPPTLSAASAGWTRWGGWGGTGVTSEAEGRVGA